MADRSKIEWTDATLFGDLLPKRCSKCHRMLPPGMFKIDRSRHEGRSFVCRDCSYIRLNPNVPGKRERIEKRAQGLAWCSECHAWLSASEVRAGKCGEHRRRADREHYATDEDFRRRRSGRASARRRGVDPVPVIAQEYLTEEFEGLCAYCDDAATTWDHVVPVIKGGQTTPDNILPSCGPCNSSKRDRDVFEWLDATGRTMRLAAIERLSHFQVI